MSKHHTDASKYKAVEKLAERISRTTGQSSEAAHREAAKIAREQDARAKGGK